MFAENELENKQCANSKQIKAFLRKFVLYSIITDRFNTEKQTFEYLISDSNLKSTIWVSEHVIDKYTGIFLSTKSYHENEQAKYQNNKHYFNYKFSESNKQKLLEFKQKTERTRVANMGSYSQTRC